MTGRHHPAPRLVIGQRIFEFDCPPQVAKGLVVVSLVVLGLAIEHVAGNIDDVVTCHDMSHTFGGNRGGRCFELGTTASAASSCILSAA